MASAQTDAKRFLRLFSFRCSFLALKNIPRPLQNWEPWMRKIGICQSQI